MNRRIGLMIIGTEILLGKRQDRHFDRSRRQIAERGYEVAWTMILPDAWEILIGQLRWAFAQDHPFFSFGGLGATPDDLTRAAAATALDQPVEPHPEAVELIRKQFGNAAEPIRIRMANLPRDATLIPNPINQIPGFALANGYFFPGFPQMAEPMSAWVLEKYFPIQSAMAQWRMILPGCKESELVELMEEFCQQFPMVDFSSLPSFGQDGYAVEIGLRAAPAELEAARDWLTQRLARANIDWQPWEEA